MQPNDSPGAVPPDWEAFYSDYRKPGFVEGFEITSKLGGGMFGLVFRARRMSIGKDYAIKFLKVDDGEVRKAVLGELEQVRYFAQIDHPNLVSIEDRGEVSGIPYLVMAFAGTETLRDKMPVDADGSGRVPTADEKSELMLAFLQSCRGLLALHERSLVHFDIKPANVFLKGGTARLGDYGLSKLVTHSQGSLSMGRGTPYYMAPEMLKRRGDQRSDIYSLGIMLYEILCGRVPFQGDSEWEVLKKHEAAMPELPAHLTAVERRALQKCLAKDPEDRFQSVAELLEVMGASTSAGTTEAFTGDGRVGGPPAMVAAAAAADGASIPGCLPPPLPHQRPKTTPPAVPRRRSNRPARRPATVNWRFVGVLAVVLVLFFSVLMTVLVSARPSMPRAHVVTTDHARVEYGSSLGNRVDRLASTILATGRKEAQRNRPRELRALDLERCDVPRDFSSYRAVLRPLTQSPRFVRVVADRCAKHGHPVWLSAVDMLQTLDYRDGFACQQAANLQRLLQMMTGIDALTVEATGCEPSARETCMFLAVADGWRQVAERFAHNEHAFEQLQRAKGKLRVVR